MTGPSTAPDQRLLLIGAGHAHLFLVRSAERLRAAGYDVTLVAPRWFHYSGTAAAVATGSLPREAGSIDVARLAARHGVRHLPARVTHLDVQAHVATTDTEGAVSWDVVSLNIGSTAAAPAALVGTEALMVKPLETLFDLDRRLSELGSGARVTVVGGGPSGVEIAAGCAAHPVRPRVRLVEARSDLAPDLPVAARRRLRRELRRAGVEVHTGRGAAAGDGAIELVGGTRLPHDLVVLATGLVPPPELQRWGIADPEGVPVLASLRHRDHPDVYAAGDCAHFLPQPLERVGVHGVRQGPVLLGALLARASGSEPPTYDPPRRYLSILDLGGRRALAVRGRWWWEGRAAYRLKRLIDRRWLARYQV